MAGCAKIFMKSMDVPLSPGVMMAPFAQSRRHLRVAFVYLPPAFLQTLSTHISMPKPIDEHSGGTVFAIMCLQK